MSFDIQTLSLSEICTDISYGYTASANTEIVGPKFLRITDIQGGVVDWDTVPYCEIPESKLNKNLLSQGDIVVARTGNSTGENYMFSGDEPSVFASYLIRFKVDSNIANPHYVWLQMRTKRWWDFVSGAKSGSAQAGANATVLGKFEVTLPPKNVQDYVVDVISCLSSKISLNTSTNQTLEEMAQAIFKSWFVDFDPVKAKMNGEQPEGMDAVTASLFPEKLVESDLGLIPDGWNINYIKDFGKVVTGKTPPKKVEDAYAEEGVPFVTPSDIDSDVFVSETKRFLSESGVEAVKKSLLPEGSICVTCIGSQMGKAVISPSEAISNQQINSVVVSKDYVRNFLFLNLRRRREEIFLIGSSGSTMPIINKSTFEKLAVLTPSEELMRSFDRSVSSLLSKIHQNAVENQTLSSLRDSLLPKLLSGEIELEPQEAKGE